MPWYTYMPKDLAIVLNNGSINSAVTTALAAQRYRLVMLHIQCSAEAASRPRAAYEQQVAHFKPYREHLLAMPFLGTMVDDSAQNVGVDPRGGALSGRLVNLLPLVATAGRVAAFYQAVAVYLGLRVGPGADDLAQATEYVQILNELLQLPCRQGELEVVAPILELERWQVVDVGFQVSVPFDRTWSCMEEQTDPCWACRGCRNREAAFQQAAKPDPLRPIRPVRP